MKVLMTLANPFTNDSRVYNEARTLIEAGHEVTILAWDREHIASPTEKIDEINVIRSYNSRLMNIFKNDVLRMPQWWLKGYKEAVKLHKKYHFDIIHSHDMTSLLIGVKLKRKFGLPLIYDAHEIYHYLIEVDVPRFFTKLAASREKKWVKNVDHIITVNEPLEKYFKSFSNKKVTIVMNCKKVQGGKYEPVKNDKFTTIFLGTLDKNRYLLDLPKVANELPDVKFIVGGMGKTDFVKLLKNECGKVKNIDFIGKLPMKEVLPKTKSADVILCLFNPNNKNNKVGLPNKVFEAMVLGKPIICTKGLHSGDFVEKEKCGVTAEYDKDSIKNAIIRLKSNPELCKKLGENGIKAANEKYNWELQGKKLLDVYRRFQ